MSETDTYAAAFMDMSRYPDPPSSKPPLEISSTSDSGSGSADSIMSDIETPTVHLTTQPKSQDSISLESLPDEVIAKCYNGLPACDLVALEHVSVRMREIITADEPSWRDCVLSRWKTIYPPSTGSHTVLRGAARHARSWKRLYAEKAACHTGSAPWFVASPSEVRAIIDSVLSIDTTPSVEVLEPVSKTDDDGESEKIKEHKYSPVSIILQGSSPPKETTLSSPATAKGMLGEVDKGDGLNVVVLVDASSSVTDDDFKAMKNFISTMLSVIRDIFCKPSSSSASSFYIDNSNSHDSDARIAFVQFNQHPKVELRLTPAGTSKVSAALADMSQLMGSTDIAAPIRKAREILTAGMADDKRKTHGRSIVLLMTDGQTHADELKESEREAQKLEEETGAIIHAVGVGRDIDQKGLVRIVSAAGEGGAYYTLRRFVHRRR